LGDFIKLKIYRSFFGSFLTYLQLNKTLVKKFKIKDIYALSQEFA